MEKAVQGAMEKLGDVCPNTISIILSEINKATFDSFCEKLVSSIKVCIGNVDKYRRRSVAKEKALIRFHQARLSILTSLWQNLADELGMTTISSLLTQAVNRRVFEQMLVEQFTSVQSLETATVSAGVLYAEEENTVRYMSGYVALKLLRKYKKEPTDKAAQFVECLSGMAVEGSESSFYEYTKQWIKLVDRGGLFHVSDSAYLFFRALELQTRTMLPQHLKNPSRSKDLLIKELMEDEDIQFLWSMLSVDISDCDEFQLLQDITELWITIRVFSVTGAWMEQYKKEKKEGLQKKKALRKTLKKSDKGKGREKSDKGHEKSDKGKGCDDEGDLQLDSKQGGDFPLDSDSEDLQLDSSEDLQPDSEDIQDSELYID